MKSLYISIITLLASAITISAQSDVPYWLIGTWTDGECNYQITDSKISVYDSQSSLIGEGTLIIDSDFVSAELDNGDYVEFIMFSDIQSICYSGGDDLYRNENKEISWLYGKWETTFYDRSEAYYASAIITPFYTQTYGGLWDDEGLTVEQMPKTEVMVSPATESIEDRYTVDHKEKMIYYILDFDIIIELEKVD